MLQTTLLGAALKRGGTDPVDHVDFTLIDLNLLDQCSDDFPLRCPSRLAQPLADARCKFLQLADHQPQLRLLVLLIGHPFPFVFQPRESLARRADPWLEFRLLQQALSVRIDQSRNALLDLLDQLHDLVNLAVVAAFRPLSPTFVLDADPSRLGQQAANILPDGRIQQVGADLLVPA